MDEWFATLGPAHRKVRHHWEGVREAEQLFGERGREAAIIHVLRDCRHIPKQEDYESGKVDKLGLIAGWPISAYINYPEEVFNSLVNHTLHGPTGKILWAFFRSPQDLANLIAGTTHLRPDEQQKTVAAWEAAHQKFRELPPFSVEGQEIFRPPAPAASEYFMKAAHEKTFQMLSMQFKVVRPAMVRVAALINPLAVIDLQFVEELRPSLEGEDALSTAKFAMPETLSIQTRLIVDPSMRRVSIVSAEKTLSISPIQVSQIPGVGIEAKFVIVPTPQLIIVSRVGDRFYLRSGIHRAYLLASLGHEEIPCLLVNEDAIPNVVGVYPAFTPPLLAEARPPLLGDAFNPDLALEVPLVKTKKMISISAEELIFPAD